MSLFVDVDEIKQNQGNKLWYIYIILLELHLGGHGLGGLQDRVNGLLDGLKSHGLGGLRDRVKGLLDGLKSHGLGGLRYRVNGLLDGLKSHGLGGIRDRVKCLLDGLKIKQTYCFLTHTQNNHHWFQ